jgi:hypothetical protein
MNLFSNLGIRLQEQYYNSEKPEDLIKRFRVRQDEGPASFVMRVVYNSVFIKVPTEDHKWWSPELTVSIEEDEKGSLIKEVTGPNPGTFTLAMFLIIGAFVIFFFALMFALSQIQLGTSPLMSFLVIGGSVAIAVIVLMILAWGRKKAHPQMEMMKDYIRQVIE